jgi:hypothetical protein
MSRVLRIASRLVLFSDRTSAVNDYEEKKADPALMTFQEFWALVGGKSHPESAYDWSVEKMNENEWDSREHYPTLLFRRKINGVSFEFRLNKKDYYQDNTFVKRDPDGNLVYINGEAQYFTKEELFRLNNSKYKRYEYAFAAFDGDNKVGVAQDEWGCILVSVAREYRNFGLGMILTKLAWEAEPGKTTGGCTPAGAGVVKKAHTEFVRDYLRKGFYSYLIRDGVLTRERVQEIIKSAGLPVQQSKSRQKFNFGSNNPEDFLLYAENGAFIIYDRKLKDLIERGDEDRNFFWYERFIKGTSFAGGGYVSDDRLFLHQFGADTPALKKLLFTLALSYAKAVGVPIHVYNEDLHMASMVDAEVDGNLVSLKGAPINYIGMANEERKFRKSFDPYDEFKNRVLELADVKYRD